MFGRNLALAVLIVGVAVTGCGKGEQAAAPVPTTPSLPAAAPGEGKTLGKLQPTNDGREIARRMVRAFKAVDSLQIASSAEQLTVSKGRAASHQESVTTFRKNPPRYSRITIDQVSGSYKSIADGSNLITYSGLTNTYVRRECRGDLALIGRMATEETPQVLTPATFLMSKDTPAGFQDFRLLRRENVRGKSALVLHASAKRDFLRVLTRQLQLPAGMNGKSGKAVIWVDPDTYFPMKSRIELVWSGKAPGARRAMAMGVAVNEKTVRVTTNPQLKDEEFTFTAPASAKEIFASRKEQAAYRP